jgi:hypothetical protein
MPTSKDRIARALAQNAASPLALGLAPALRALLGVPEGAGYTAEMVPLIMELQASFGIGADGVVGQHTHDKLTAQRYLEGVDCRGLWPADASAPSERRAHYLGFYQRFDRGPTTHPRLLALRGAYPFARKTHRMIHARRYDDAFVLITDQDAVVFRGATHAYQRSFAKSSGAVASIRPGVYRMALAGSSPPIFNLMTPSGDGNLPAFRDNDHDGVISESELAAALGAKGGLTEPGVGAIATEIQFHPGYETLKKPNERFSSIGCQTAPLPELERLMQAGHAIDYVLANAADLVKPRPPADAPNV